jgi:hypothetical protein
MSLFFLFFKSTPIGSRSGASSSSANYAKRTPRTSASQSNEMLVLASNSPIQNEANSQSGSLGASISDLSSEPPSELSDNYNLNDNSNSPTVHASTSQQSLVKNGSSVIPKTIVQNYSKSSANNSGTSTPTKPFSTSYGTSPLAAGSNSRLPVPKK